MHHDGSLSVEVPTAADAATLALLKADTFTETFAANNNPETLAAHVADAFTVDRMIAELADPTCLTVWVLDAGAPVGYVKMNLPPNDSEPELANGLEVEQIYFRRSHQGRGLGRRLIDHAIAEVRARGLPFVWLGVWEHNIGAIGFYERLGFRVCGEHTFHLGDEPQRDLLMRLDITGRRVQLLYFPDCPNWQVTDERLREVAAQLGLSIDYRLVTTAEEAERVSFRGSPTILIDGVDPFAVGDEPIGLSCRIYRTPNGFEGSPTTEQIAAALAPNG